MEKKFPKDQVYWYTTKTPEMKPLAENISVDVVIVGGGLAGLSCAQRAHELGLSVAVVEQNFCGSGASGKSSGMITQDSELELTDLIENHGKENARRLWNFVGEGMYKMRRNIEQHGIECDYQVQDCLFIANSSRGMKKVHREHSSREVLGFESYLYNQKTLPQIIGSNKYEGAVRYPGTFAINSYLYTQGMKDLLEKLGVKVYENTKIAKIEKDRVRTENGHHVDAKYIVVCCDRFAPDLGKLKKDVYHVQTFLTISKPIGEDEAEKFFPSGNLMAFDSEMIYQYYRITGDHRLLLGGGTFAGTYAPKETHHPKALVEKLYRYLDKYFPGHKIEFEYAWPGMLGVAKDLVPIAGRDPENPNLFYVTAATGLAWAQGLGGYIAEKIALNSEEYDDYFSPTRKFPYDPLARAIQLFIGKRAIFAISHGFVKYLN